VLLTVKEGQLSSLLPGVRNGEIDIAIGSVDPMAPPEGVMIEPLFTSPFCIIARKGHPWRTPIICWRYGRPNGCCQSPLWGITSNCKMS
jgi:DNA-binding transcriptional LysR family regulator